MRENRWKIIGSILAMFIAIICIIIGIVILCNGEPEELSDESIGKATSDEDIANDENGMQQGETINSQPAKVNFFNLEAEEVKLYACEKTAGTSYKQFEIDELQGYALEDKEVREIAWLFQSHPFMSISEEMPYNFDAVIAFSKGAEIQYMAIDMDKQEAYYHIEIEGKLKTYRVFLRDSQVVYIKHIIESHIN